ncbi:MAG: M20/M25/M40 family metallo-hydrolase, partial [Leifsonia sp.]
TEAGHPVLFCAHLDTVEPGAVVRAEVVDGIVRAAEGEVLGADNKAAVAAILDGVRRVLAEGIPHAGVEILFTVQEELGLKGAAAFDTTALHSSWGYLFDMFGPLGGLVVSAPSYRVIQLEFTGRAAHASTPEQGASAITAAAMALSRFPHGRVDEATTLNIGTISGGSALNVVAGTAQVDIEVRSRDDRRGQAVVAELLRISRRAAEDCGCTVSAEVETLYNAYTHDDASAALQLAERAVRQVGRMPHQVQAIGGSDANILNAIGLSCVNIASGMHQIHTDEEWVAVDDLATLSDLTVALINEARNSQ